MTDKAFFRVQFIIWYVACYEEEPDFNDITRLSMLEVFTAGWLAAEERNGINEIR